MFAIEVCQRCLYQFILIDCNRTQTHNHLVRKGTLNHLPKLAKWLSCVVSTYLYRVFDCIFLSCHVRVSEWILTLYLPECKGTPYSKHTRTWHNKKIQSFILMFCSKKIFTLKEKNNKTWRSTLYTLSEKYSSH